MFRQGDTPRFALPLFLVVFPFSMRQMKEQGQILLWVFSSFYFLYILYKIILSLKAEAWVQEFYCIYKSIFSYCQVWFMVFNATFNNISVIMWRSVLLVEKTMTCHKSLTNFITYCCIEYNLPE